jgi:acyl-CoA thioesterase I
MTSLRVCFVGDSITAGTGDVTMLGWPGRLCAAEAAAGHDLSCYNLGIRGDTSDGVAARWEAECRTRLPAGVPAALVFAIGINDGTEQDGAIRVPLDRSVANMRGVLTAATAWLPALWVGPTPVDEAKQPHRTEEGHVRDKRNGRIAAYNDAFRALAEEVGVPYLDLFARLKDDADWPGRRTDGLHPDHEGYRRMAELIGAFPGWRRLLA